MKRASRASPRMHRCTRWCLSRMSARFGYLKIAGYSTGPWAAACSPRDSSYSSECFMSARLALADGGPLRKCEAIYSATDGAQERSMGRSLAFKKWREFCRAGIRARSNEATACLSAQPVQAALSGGEAGGGGGVADCLPFPLQFSCAQSERNH